MPPVNAAIEQSAEVQREGRSRSRDVVVGEIRSEVSNPSVPLDRLLIQTLLLQSSVQCQPQRRIETREIVAASVRRVAEKDRLQPFGR